MKLLWFSTKFVLTIIVGAAALAGSVALLAPASHSLSGTTTPLGDLTVTINQPAARSIVYDRFGNVMGQYAIEDRQPVKLKDIPPVVVNAVLSIEDRKFYEHHGVDLAGTARALFKNVDVGGISQGGSTITQQLVKNALSTNRKRDLKTKVKEAILAMRLEHQLSKGKILEDYLNLVYFGNGAYGVNTAAERYFNKPLKQVSLAEAALVAGLIQSPEALNPARHPDAAARRRSEVLDAMVANGKVSAKVATLAKSVPLPTHLYYPNSRPLDYYIDEVKTQLIVDNPNIPGQPSDALGSTQQARANALYRGGLKISTSYDPYIQYAAGKAVADILPRSKYTASLVVIDNSDGGVRAIANGQSFAQSQFDPATEGSRQAGSSFKVFTLAAALSHGYSPKDTVSTQALHWRKGPGNDYKNSFYNLTTHDDCSGGALSLYQAIAQSDNCAFMRTELSLGPANYGDDGVQQVIDMAHKMGITSNLDPTIVSTTLGTQGVSPVEMTEAYSSLANLGIQKGASFITKIVAPGGKVVYQHNPAGTRVLDTNVATSMIDMMKGVLKTGTARASLGNFPRPAAGKTGTTDSEADAWFIGFTPQYTAGVWMGDPTGEHAMVGLPIGRVFGATYPAKIWREFMLAATATLPPLDFPKPDETLWPRSSYINEFGRKVGSQSPYRYRQTTPNTSNQSPVTTPATPITNAPVTQPPQQVTTPVTHKKTPTTKAGP